MPSISQPWPVSVRAALPVAPHRRWLVDFRRPQSRRNLSARRRPTPDGARNCRPTRRAAICWIVRRSDL